MIRIIIVFAALLFSNNIFSQTFTITLDKSKICEGDTVSFRTNPSGINCDWKFADSDTIAQPNISTNVSAVLVTYKKAGTYNIIAKRTSGTESDTVQIKVSGVDAGFTIKKNKFISYKRSFISNLQPSPFFAPTIFKWDLGNSVVINDTISSSNDDDVYRSAIDYTYRDSGVKVINLIVTNQIGCTDSKTLVDTIHNVFSAPNVFTPNGDGINDIFTARTNGKFEFTISIYSRWGNLVFESKKPEKTVVWDGRLKDGSYASTGVYYYVVIPENSETADNLTGFFHLYSNKKK